MLKLPFPAPTAPHDLLAITRQCFSDAFDRLRAGERLFRIPDRFTPIRPREPLHFHLWPEPFLQVSGVSDVEMPWGRMHVKTGEIFIAPRSLAHVESCRRQRGFDFANIVMARREAACVRFHFACGASGGRPHAQGGMDVESAQVSSLFRYWDDAITAAWSDSPRRHDITGACGVAAIGVFLDILDGATPPISSAPPKVVRCKDLVLSHLSEPGLSVQQLAEWLTCAPDYLSHLFRQETGETLTGYMNRQRVQYARGLLEDPALNISEIAWACGYRDPGYFTRVFRAQTGASPSAFRSELTRGS